MIWPFNRKPKPVHVGPDSVDWKPGDIAECIFVPDRSIIGHYEWPKVGQKLMVSRVGYGTSVSGTVTSFYLMFVGMSRHHGCRSDCFRKIILTDTGAGRWRRAILFERGGPA